jgi:ribosomal-protein-alanine N-acetyltransferase
MEQETKLIIRPAKGEKDIELSAAMMAASDPWITLGMTYEQCLPAFEGPCKEVYIAEYEHEIAGFVIIQTGGTFKGYIQTLCVAEAYRGKGLGTKILQFCEERILQMSPNIFICVSSFNKGAIKLYDAFGFVLVGELPNFVKQGFTELLMRKTAGAMLGYKPAQTPNTVV